VDDIEGMVFAHGIPERTNLTPETSRASQVSNQGAAQFVSARFLEVSQSVRDDGMAGREPFDERYERRDHVFAAAAIKSSGHHQRDAHTSL
jgi:hypothetical protein